MKIVLLIACVLFLQASSALPYADYRACVKAVGDQCFSVAEDNARCSGAAGQHLDGRFTLKNCAKQVQPSTTPGEDVYFSFKLAPGQNRGRCVISNNSPQQCTGDATESHNSWTIYKMEPLTSGRRKL